MPKGLEIKLNVTYGCTKGARLDGSAPQWYSSLTKGATS